MEKKGSWHLFFMTLGFLMIMLSPQWTQPKMAIFCGLLLVCFSGIKLKKIMKLNRGSERYDKVSK